MNTDPARTDAADDWLERALAADAIEHRAAHVDDAGFAARVMGALPAPAPLTRWQRPIRWTLAGVAGAAIAAAVPGFAADVAREVFRAIAAQPVSLASVAIVLAAVGAATLGAAAFVLDRD